MSSDTPGQPSLKRARTLLACQSCRSRKLSCDGARPCARCREDGRECTDVVNAERTPLTRKRMTELEQRIFDYENLWHALYPGLPLHTVLARLSANGLETTVRELRRAGRIEVVSQVHVPDAPHTAGSGSAPYPPTRPASPRALSLGLVHDMEPASHGQADKWNEDESVSGPSPQDANDGTPGNDYGTGVRGGVGYMGLSSAATLLRAVQKFAPVNIVPPTQPSLGDDSSSPSSTAWWKHRPGILPLRSDIGIRDATVLPPHREIGPLVDNYFQYFHALHPIVHEPTIRAQLTGALPLPANNSSRVLLNMIFATGAFDSATDHTIAADGSHYYDRARANLQQDLFAEGSLVLVQGLAIMAIYLQRCNKPNAGYLCLGLAIRMAMALGMHVSVDSGKTSSLTVLESEIRNRVWWCLVTLEAGMSMTYGRPHGIALASLSTVNLPVNTEDEHLTVSSTTRPADAIEVTQHTALIIQARLAQMAFRSQDRISRSLPSPTVEQVKWCGDYFRDELVALPAYMRSPAPPPYRLAVAIQNWRARDYRSVLYRPVFLAAAWSHGAAAASDEAVQKIIDNCRALALENLQDIAEYVHTNPDPHRGSEWYTLYFAIQASLTILLSIVWEPYHPRAQLWRTRIMETITWLYTLQSMKQLAMSYAKIMEEVIYTRPGATANDSTHAVLPQASDSEHFSSDVDTFNFEQYFSEIWDGQTQIVGVPGDVYLGFGADAWDGIINELRGF